MILGDAWEEIVFLKGLVKFGEIRNVINIINYKKQKFEKNGNNLQPGKNI